MIHAGTQIRPRPIFCVIEHAYRDRKVAEDACAGRFTENGVTLYLGLEPDCMAVGLPEDEEWQIAWTNFYFGLNLATAFADTGEKRFQRAWEKLVASWIRQVPVDFGPTDAIGRRIQNWIYAWNIFADAPHFTGLAEGLDEKIIASLAQQARYLRNHLTAERNHRTLELYALLMVALALPEAALDADLLDFSKEAFCQNLLSDVRRDGVHREHSTHYHMMVLRSFLAARENVRQFGLSFPKEYDRRLERACEFAMHCHRPDGDIPTLSDSDAGNYFDLLQLAASMLGRSDFLYAATAAAHGTPPQKRYVSFPYGGYHIQRSGWGERETAFDQERFLIFDCGSLGDGGHGHYDMLNVEVAAAGKSLLIDPGRYTYSEHPPNLRRWFKGTAAHNTVCIDGLDQVPYRRGKPKKPLPQAQLIERWSAPGFDVLAGSADSPCYEVIHTRRIFFIADEYWIIWDSLRGERPHRFDLRFHLSPEAWDRTQISAGAVRAPGLALVLKAFSELVDPQQLDTRAKALFPLERPFPRGLKTTLPPINAGASTLEGIQQLSNDSRHGGGLQLEPGWFAPQYGVKLNAPVISAVIEGANSADFVTLVMPLDVSQQVPELEVCQIPNNAQKNLSLKISGAGPNSAATDYVSWSASVEDHENGPFRSQASSAWCRSTGRQEDSRLAACNVRELRSQDNKISFTADSQALAWVTWDHQHGFAQGSRRFE
jgi:heparinase II/III-like protein